MESGHISIHAENILPIIKRWLYSEKDIYLRELVSNAADALTKLAKLALVGEVPSEPPEAKITVTVDKPGKRLIITDTGLGMTEDEIKRYINQVAFSGISDFLEKYKDKDDAHQVIGHFGLGFYSAFMVATKVEIDTLSYKEGAAAVHWSCDGSTAFTMEPSERREVGTSIILHIADDSLDMLDEAAVKALLTRYCAFIRYPIEIGGSVVNDPRPLWTRAPSELTDKDYEDFYYKLFPGSAAPLFWVHLNVDYPFNLRGVLYFPKLKNELEGASGEIKLYCNQVYVADNVKELIPEFLTLLKGVVDCPDLPLNVSRSYLQTDPTVHRIAEHITKKVADRLAGMAKTEREAYEKFWDDIHPFVKFGMMRDAKFAERMQEHILWRSAHGKHLTLAEYAQSMEGKLDANVVLYCADPNAQAAYLTMLKDHGLDAVIADAMIDQHFISFFEMHTQRKWKFQRVDAEVSKHLLDAESSLIVDSKDYKTTAEKVEKLFRDFLSRERVKVRVERFKSDKVPAVLVFDEQQRRMKEMAKHPAFAALAAGLPDDHTLVVNQSSPAIQNLARLAVSFNRDEEVKLIVNQIYDLAWLQQGELTADMMQSFIARSTAILGRLGRAGVDLGIGAAPEADAEVSERAGGVTSPGL